MKSIASFILFFLTAIMCVTYIIFSTFIQQQTVEKELMLTEAIQSFLDITSDRGAISLRDYEQLMSNLHSTGGSFSVTVTVQRLYAIPNTSALSLNPAAPGEPLGFTRDYRPVYAFSTKDGSFLRLDPEMNAGGTDLGYGPAYLNRHDLITLNIEQTTLMSHQTNMLRQLQYQPEMRTWTQTRGVRNTGNAVIDNQIPPIPYDGMAP